MGKRDGGDRLRQTRLHYETRDRIIRLPGPSRLLGIISISDSDESVSGELYVRN